MADTITGSLGMRSKQQKNKMQAGRLRSQWKNKMQAGRLRSQTDGPTSMTDTSVWRVSHAAYDRMVARAEADYPEETCGFLFGPEEGGGGGGDDELIVVPMENIQNRLHQEDPETYTRNARLAYCFDPLEMQRVMDEHERAGQPLCGVYHSHPDHDSYFSETDSAAAAPFGEPSFPGVVYPVFSVKNGKVADLKAFDWSSAEAKYVEIPVEIV